MPTNKWIYLRKDRSIFKMYAYDTTNESIKIGNCRQELLIIQNI